MQQLNIYDAKTNFSRLIEQVNEGESFIIARSGKPMAKLVPFDKTENNRFCFGTLKGKIKASDDFDEPLSDELLADFESDL